MFLIKAWATVKSYAFNNGSPMVCTTFSLGAVVPLQACVTALTTVSSSVGRRGAADNEP